MLLLSILLACDLTATIKIEGDTGESSSGNSGGSGGNNGGGSTTDDDDDTVVPEPEVDPLAGCRERVITTYAQSPLIYLMINDYDAQARIVQQQSGQGRPGRVKITFSTEWQYDTHGQLDEMIYESYYRRQSYQSVMDYLHAYDDEGRVVLEAIDYDADGHVEQQTAWYWSEDGYSREGTMTYFYDNTMSYNYDLEEWYDEDGNLIYQTYDWGTGGMESTWMYIDGKVRRYEVNNYSEGQYGEIYSYMTTTEYSYNSEGQLEEEVMDYAGSTYTYSTSYSYDNAGNVSRIDYLYDYNDPQYDAYAYDAWITQSFDDAGRVLVQDYYYDTATDHTWANTPYNTFNHHWDCPTN